MAKKKAAPTRIAAKKKGQNSREGLKKAIASYQRFRSNKAARPTIHPSVARSDNADSSKGATRSGAALRVARESRQQHVAALNRARSPGRKAAIQAEIKKHDAYIRRLQSLERERKRVAGEIKTPTVKSPIAAAKKAAAKKASRKKAAPKTPQRIQAAKKTKKSRKKAAPKKAAPQRMKTARKKKS